MATQPIYLISLNKTPERAALLVDQLIKSLDNNYGVIHVANSTSLQELKVMLEALIYPPSILICSSQWTAEEQQQANTVAKALLPQVRIINIPPGLDVREGSRGILHFLKDAMVALHPADSGK